MRGDSFQPSDLGADLARLGQPGSYAASLVEVEALAAGADEVDGRSHASARRARRRILANSRVSARAWHVHRPRVGGELVHAPHRADAGEQRQRVTEHVVELAAA